MVLIIGSLCFSVGEGLRLTPFPTAASSQQESGTLSVAKDTAKLNLSKYGPLDVPSQLQKRTKRQTIDFAPHPIAESHQVVSSVWYRLEDEAVQFKSLRYVPRPAGRAPPRLS